MEPRVPDIYVVEDDPRLLSAIVMVLEEEGFVVRAFSRPAAALAALAHERPRVVVTDQQMPGMTGNELLLAARASIDAARLPKFVLITGAEIPRTILSGFDGVLLKPFRLDDLLALTKRFGLVRARSGTIARAGAKPEDDEGAAGTS